LKNLNLPHSTIQKIYKCFQRKHGIKALTFLAPRKSDPVIIAIKSENISVKFLESILLLCVIPFCCKKEKGGYYLIKTERLIWLMFIAF
jgi:hypothetical protein